MAFWLVVLPESRRGIITAATLAWARALGEFGPLLVFAGATRLRTEVLSTTVFLELSVGRLEAAVAVSLHTPRAGQPERYTDALHRTPGGGTKDRLDGDHAGSALPRYLGKPPSARSRPRSEPPKSEI